MESFCIALRLNITKFILSCNNVKATTSSTYQNNSELECNAVTNSQYSRRETIELNHVPAEIHQDVLEDVLKHCH